MPLYGEHKCENKDKKCCNDEVKIKRELDGRNIGFFKNVADHSATNRLFKNKSGLK